MEIKVNPRKRSIVAIASLNGVVGIILLMLRADIAQAFYLKYDFILALGLMIIALSAFVFFFLYLQGSFSINSAASNRDYESSSSLYDYDMMKDSSKKINDLQFQFENLASKISKYSFQKTAIDETEKMNIINDIKNTLKENLNNDLLNTIENKYSKTIIENQKLSLIIEDFNRISDRIKKEIYALGRRANINLLIGSFTTVAAVGVLIYWVFTNSTEFSDITKLLSSYIPRISIIIFVELFAYFFLRLYKSNLHDIKYFQNELTNIESKLISLRSAITLKNDGTTDYVIKSLSNTERNLLIKESMTTEEIEKSKVEADKINKLLESISISIKEFKK